MKAAISVILVIALIALGLFGLSSWQKKNTSTDSRAQKRVGLEIGEGVIKITDPYANISQNVDFKNKQATVKYGGNTVNYTIKDVLQPFNIDNDGDLEYPFLMEADYSDGKKVEYLIIASPTDDHFVAVDQVAIGNPARIDEIHPYNDTEIVVECYIGVGVDKEMVNLTYDFANDKIIPGKDNVDIDTASPKPKETPKPTATPTKTSTPKPTATQAKTNTKGRVALTFDDGPGRYTSDFLDTLKNKGVKGTFFIIGQNAESKPDYVARAYNEGNDVGNHTYSHPDLKKLSYDAQMDEISKCNNVLKKIVSGLSVKWMRPPYGNYNDDTLDVLSKLGLQKMLWTIDTRDWSGKSAADIASAALEGVKDGSVILMHDGVANSSETIKALPDIIDGLKNLGYQMVTITELKK